MDDDRENITRKILVDSMAGSDAVRVQIHRVSHLEIRKRYFFPEHLHAHGEIIIPTAAAYECELNGTRITVPAGRLLLIQPGDRHADMCRERIELTFVIFSLQDVSGSPWCHGILNAALPAESRVQETTPAQQALLGFLMQSNATGEIPGLRLARETAAKTFFWQTIVGIPDAHLTRAFLSALERGSFQRRVTEYFQDHYRQPLDVLSLAKAMGMSKRTLEYRFRHVLGVSPARSFLAFRIRMAVELLAQGECVYAVAEALGFADPFYFSTVFKRVMGYPPSRLSRQT